MEINAIMNRFMPPPLPQFSAVLLAGGKSSRMGRDKAGIVFEGRALWERQLATLRSLGPAEIFISGKPDGPYAGAGVEILTDLTPGCGPLSGLEAVLKRTTQPRALVLAIDLPAMTADFLTRLIAATPKEETGAVPWLDGWFEPLAAVYPRQCLELVRERLRSGDYAMQAFLRDAIARGLVIPFEVESADARLFRNVNRPADLEGSVEPDDDPT